MLFRRCFLLSLRDFVSLSLVFSLQLDYKSRALVHCDRDGEEWSPTTYSRNPILCSDSRDWLDNFTGRDMTKLSSSHLPKSGGVSCSTLFTLQVFLIIVFFLSTLPCIFLSLLNITTKQRGLLFCLSVTSCLFFLYFHPHPTMLPKTELGIKIRSFSWPTFFDSLSAVFCSSSHLPTLIL